MLPLSKKFPWTVTFIREWWPNMSLLSVLRLRDYEIRNERGNAVPGRVLSLKMSHPVTGVVSLREVGSDILTFSEILKEEAYQVVLPYVEHCRTVIDLGASTGLTTLYLSEHYPSCRFFSVEPHPGSYQLMTLNLKHLIEEGRCRTLMAAVWRRDTMLVGSIPDHPEHYSIFETREAGGNGSEPADTVGLSMPAIITQSGFETIDILKIDIEGSEVELFQGDLSWLARVKSIVIAFHGDSREDSGFDSLMQQHGFRVIDSGTDTYVAVRS